MLEIILTVLSIDLVILGFLIFLVAICSFFK